MKWIIKYLLFICCCITISAEDVYQFPQKINLFKYIYDKKDYDYAPFLGYIYFFPEIRILGWSDKGKVAFSIFERESWIRPEFIRWVIYDFIDDKILWEIKTVNSKMETLEEELLEYSYSQNKNIINEKLLQYGIKSASVEYNRLPIRYNNKDYKFKIIQKMESRMDYDFYYIIKEYDVIVETDNKEKIILHCENPYDIGPEQLEEIYLCGYFISPFENRALIIIAQQEYTYEEAELRYSFLGYHLESGFE